MTFTTGAFLVALTGWACRWAAHRARVRPPRQFAIAEPRWWLPPLPAGGEFATAGARRLEVAGRALVLAGVFAMLAAALARRAAA